jgi:hypothetical protein
VNGKIYKNTNKGGTVYERERESGGLAREVKKVRVRGGRVRGSATRLRRFLFVFGSARVNQTKERAELYSSLQPKFG